jgi:hypothetical protein
MVDTEHLSYEVSRVFHPIEKDADDRRAFSV